LLTQAEALLVEDPPARFKTLNRLVHVGFEEDIVATMQLAQLAEQVAAVLGDLELRRARLWVWAVRGFVDPSFQITDIRGEAEAAAAAFAAAGNIDALLDVYDVMVLIDLNLAHWQATARWARLGLKLAAATGLDQRREDFTMSLSNAMVWGSSDAVESLAIHDELLASTTRRLTRVWLVSATAILWAILGDRDKAEETQAAVTSMADELGIRRSEFRHAFMHYVLDDLPEAIRLAREEAALLEQGGETGRRSTMVGLEAWLLALSGDDVAAEHAAEESRRLGAPDDAVTQILWRSAMGVVLARRGEIADADRVTTKLVEIADSTDSMDAGSAWLARGMVLSTAGRTEEATEAGRRAREIYSGMGFVNGLRRVEALLGG
jgi:tetratricopeptide (TPR) repeat protein